MIFHLAWENKGLGSRLHRNNIAEGRELFRTNEIA